MANNSTALPPAFLRSTEDIMGKERFARFMAALAEEPPTCIRLNPKKVDGAVPAAEISEGRIPWCAEGYYLSHRPNFTFDPLLHAGCYYVQEAASQFIAHCARHILSEMVPPDDGSMRCALDLCAAPGGKSTALRATLPDDWLLVCNEPVRKRVQILSENMQKWGYPRCVVTNNYPRDFKGMTEKFDIMVCDVPCSGEGMFRKDPAAIGEWSPQNVERCWQLQRQIVSDSWSCLRPGGVLIYSTCTLNTLENEENVRWITTQLGATPVAIPTLPEWGICGSLLPGFDAPVYRFIPGLTRSEGLFVAVLRKKDGEDGTSIAQGQREARKKTATMAAALSRMNIVHSSYTPVAIPDASTKERKGRHQQKEQMSCSEVLSTRFDKAAHTLSALSYDEAIAYLRREAIVLPPDTPGGMVVVTYEGHPLGVVKNIGTRANNLHPREWAIKSTYTPFFQKIL